MRRLVLVVAALALLVAACGGTGGVVATVNGAEILLSEVDDLRAGDAGSLDRESFNEDLRNAIVEVAVVQAAEERFDISFTPEEIEGRRAQLEQEIEALGQGTYEEYIEERGFTDTRIRRIAHQQLVQEAVSDRLTEEAGPLTDEDIQSEYDRQLLALSEACVQHVLVATEEEAQQVVERVESGEDLAEVAREVSIDPSAQENGGELPCGPLSGFVPAFAQAAYEAEVGEVAGPVQSQFGYHVIKVTSRETPTLDEAREQLTATLEATRGTELFREWLLEVLSEAEVQVASEYGRWATEPVPQILPPQ